MRVAPVVGLGLAAFLLTACGPSTPPRASLDGLAALRLAEACRMDDAFAAVAREREAAAPGTLRYAAALQDEAVLLRDRHDDAAAERVEGEIAQLDGITPDAVRGDTMREVAALRQRRAASLGRPTC